MWQDDEQDFQVDLWSLAIGTTAGLAAGILLSRRGRPPEARSLQQMERRITEALREDRDLTRRDITIEALTERIVELSGSVYTEEEADRAVQRVQAVPGIRTVLNRLSIEAVESHLQETRQRREAGDPSLNESQWNGMRVGTGLRRQGDETEPDRDSDHVGMRERELGVDRVQELASEDAHKLNPAVEGHSSGNAGPLAEGGYEDADHDRLGNPPDEPLQDINPESGVHENVKKGTELTLEESGVEGELIERDLENRS